MINSEHDTLQIYSAPSNTKSQFKTLKIWRTQLLLIKYFQLILLHILQLFKRNQLILDTTTKRIRFLKLKTFIDQSHFSLCIEQTDQFLILTERARLPCVSICVDELNSLLRSRLIIKRDPDYKLFPIVQSAALGQKKKR